MWVDSHCHIDFPQFDADREAALARARARGVMALVNVGVSLPLFPRVLAVARAHDDIYASVGVHPCSAHNGWGEGADFDPQTLIDLAADAKVVAVGETGLDFHYKDNPSADVQEASFRAHVEAARALDAPVIIHCRDADEAMTAFLQREQARAPFRALLHCFASGKRLADAAREMGITISLSGVATFKNAQSVRDAVAGTAPELLLVETDAPYLAPAPERGGRNEPARVADVGAFVAPLFGMDTQAFARRTSENFFRLFPRAQNHPFARALAQA